MINQVIFGYFSGPNQETELKINDVEGSTSLDKDITETKQESFQCPQALKSIAKNLVMEMVSISAVSVKENKFGESEESKFYRKFLKTWEKYFQEEEYLKRKQAASVMGLRQLLRRDENV